MLAEDVCIQFAGFEPSQDMRTSLYFVLNQMHLRSPSQSFLSATFTLTNGLFEGVIKITSSAENFVAKATHAQLPDLGSQLFDKVLLQLDKWKSLRFQ